MTNEQSNTLIEVLNNVCHVLQKLNTTVGDKLDNIDISLLDIGRYLKESFEQDLE